MPEMREGIALPPLRVSGRLIRIRIVIFIPARTCRLQNSSQKASNHFHALKEVGDLAGTRGGVALPPLRVSGRLIRI